jgi:hypothetical protein
MIGMDFVNENSATLGRPIDEVDFFGFDRIVIGAYRGNGVWRTGPWEIPLGSSAECPYARVHILQVIDGPAR